MLKKQKVSTEHDKSVKKYFKELAKCQPLTREEEFNLWHKYKYENDIEARNKLVSANLKFVASIARQYQGRGLSYADLIAEGNIGLIKAMDKFDAERGYKVISYSVWWIRQTIMEALEKRNSSNNEDLPNDYEKQVTEDDEEIYVDNYSLGYVQEKEEEYTQTEVINFLMNYLSRREKNIITEYYGLNGRKPKTLEEIGVEYGLTKERIRQIKNLSFKKMRSIALATGVTMTIFCDSAN